MPRLQVRSAVLLEVRVRGSSGYLDRAAGALLGGAGSAPVTVVPSLAGTVVVGEPLAASLPGNGAGALLGGAGSAPVAVVRRSPET